MRENPQPSTGELPSRGRTATAPSGGCHAAPAGAPEEPESHLPRLQGSFSVGTVVHTWADSSRDEPATEDPDDHRQLILQVWYPAEAAPEMERYPFFPDLPAFQWDW